MFDRKELENCKFFNLKKLNLLLNIMFYYLFFLNFMILLFLFNFSSNFFYLFFSLIFFVLKSVFLMNDIKNIINFNNNLILSINQNEEYKNFLKIFTITNLKTILIIGFRFYLYLFFISTLFIVAVYYLFETKAMEDNLLNSLYFIPLSIFPGLNIYLIQIKYLE